MMPQLSQLSQCFYVRCWAWFCKRQKFNTNNNNESEINALVPY